MRVVTKKNVEKVEDKTVAQFNNGGFSDDQLRSVRTAEDAMRLAAEMYGAVDSITDLEIGNGFTMLGDNKDRLVGVPFLVMATDLHEGDWGQFASALLFTLDGTNARLILTDGSTGICEQIRQLRESTGKAGGYHVPNGLRKSTYDTCRECGRPCPKGKTVHDPGCGAEIGDARAEGVTYYFDLSGA
jgi:hypothetical protein